MEMIFGLWIALFVAPLILGAYAVAQDADVKTLNRYFGAATAMFAAALVLSTIALFFLNAAPPF